MNQSSCRVPGGLKNAEDERGENQHDKNTRNQQQPFHSLRFLFAARESIAGLVWRRSASISRETRANSSRPASAFFRSSGFRRLSSAITSSGSSNFCCCFRRIPSL